MELEKLKGRATAAELALIEAVEAAVKELSKDADTGIGDELRKRAEDYCHRFADGLAREMLSVVGHRELEYHREHLRSAFAGFSRRFKEENTI